LVAGAGFEPAIPRLRDYEPNLALSPKFHRIESCDVKECTPGFLRLEQEFSFSSCGIIREFLQSDELPRAITRRPAECHGIMLFKPMPWILTDADVEPMAGGTLEDISEIRFA